MAFSLPTPQAAVHSPDSAKPLRAAFAGALATLAFRHCRNVGVLMLKKRLSSVDLSWMIFERMRDEFGGQRGVSVAVVRDSNLGWRAILEGRSRRHLSPAAIRKLRSIEDEFRSSYSLDGD